MKEKEYVTRPELGMMVRHDEIYKGKEVMKIVGIRKDSVELEGDYSGGTHNVTQKDWMPLSGTFRYREKCNNLACMLGQLNNLQCNYPNCEPYE